MKCPKCQYVGFDAIDRCRHCGFEFALARPVSSPADLPLHPLDGEQPPLVEDEWPLMAPPVPLPRPAGTPLSVRRSASDPQRSRRYLRSEEPMPAPLPLDIALDLVSLGASRTDAGAAIEGGAHEMSNAESGAPAAVSPRVLAALIDLGCVLGVLVALMWATLRVTELPRTQEGLRVLALMPGAGMGTLAGLVYQVVGLVGCGQTLGKMLMGVKVQMRGGGGVGIDTAVTRAAFALAAVASLGAVYLPFLLLPGRRPLHDRLTGTEVVVR
jgi:uncharacterized RDD family membrane protein YckC